MVQLKACRNANVYSHRRNPAVALRSPLALVGVFTVGVRAVLDEGYPTYSISTSHKYMQINQSWVWIRIHWLCILDGKLLGVLLSNVHLSSANTIWGARESSDTSNAVTTRARPEYDEYKVLYHAVLYKLYFPVYSECSHCQWLYQGETN